ncbi:MAG: 3-isopropylmalate dehydrogenase [Deltaproteobacteria bacterium]|nr:3-isopropylmalate dehydrogenase [Deltaproteobacteria bacterium]MBW2128423.1 3-isopropylmalate dehydrogenase [Deltaproteobacteria bacterium]MBW2303894.1 3-isopropylmalate dehydrogenase [Deltaproteobacteria bacterium]
MATYDVAVIPGDGTGPEVVREGVKCLEAVSRKYGLDFRFQNYDLGGEKYLREGVLLPDEVIEELRGMDAIFLGAIGHPEVKPGILEKEILLKARFELDLYINLRPVLLLPGVETPLKDKGPEDIDFVVVRENTEGVYAGGGGFFKKGTPEEIAIQESVNTRKGVERCIRYAFDLCRKRDRKKLLTLCAKTNVLIYESDLWFRVFEEVKEEYPDIRTNYQHVDALCMWMVKNPEQFDVIVTGNMFGDIITDLGAVIQGGLGIAAGGNINPDTTAMFEPIGGSAPKYTGLNIINPMAAIGAAQMMLEYLGEGEAADWLLEAMKKVLLNDLKSMDAGKMGYGTSEVGDLVAGYVESS